LNAATDAAAKDKAKFKENSMKEIQNIQRGLDSHKGLDDATRNQLKEQIASIQKLLDAPNTADDDLQKAIKALKDKAGAILTAAYQASQSSTPPPEPPK